MCMAYELNSTNVWSVLIKPPHNFTGTYFADTAGDFAHDQVTRFLSNSKLSPRIIRDKTLVDIPLSLHGFILF